MLRDLAAVLVSYLVMAIVRFVAYSIAYVAMGTEAAFEPRSYEVTPLWIGATFVLGFVAAAVAALACIRIARNRRVVGLLAMVVLIVGMGGNVLPRLMANAERHRRPLVREGPTSNFRAMQLARQPGFALVVGPLINTLGVLTGGRLRRDEDGS